MRAASWPVAAALAAALVVVASGAWAGTVSLSGPMIQGGLVVGVTEPGARVALDGRQVRVAADGRFLLGFGRDAAEKATLRVTHADGSVTERTLAIKKRRYQEQRINGLPRKQVSPGPKELARIKEDNRLIAAVRAHDTAEPFFESGFAWPAEGRISGVYGSRRILNGKPRRPHNGVDIAAAKGTPVAAAADGVVALAQPDMFLTGKTVMIDHGHGLTSVYIHMSALRVTAGQHVRKGETIGAVGRTGRATAPHLHWGLTLFGTHLDPALVAGPMESAVRGPGR